MTVLLIPHHLLPGTNLCAALGKTMTGHKNCFSMALATVRKMQRWRMFAERASAFSKTHLRALPTGLPQSQV